MYCREIEVLAPKTLGDSGTETIDIDELDPFTKLDFMFRLTNGGAIAENVPPQSIISKIEIIDGGQVWFSLSGREALALACYELKHFPKMWLMTMASLGQRIRLPIHFGRFLGDTEYAFDPTRLKNPQIKFTYAKNTLHATGTLELGVFATVMEGVPSPPKCLMTKSVREFTSASSGIEPTDLWTDYPIRRLFVQVGTMIQDVRGSITQFKLTADEKITLFDLTNEELRELCEEVFGVFVDRQFIAADHSDYKYSLLGDVESVQVQPGGPDVLIGAWAASFSGIFLTVQSHNGAAVSDHDSVLTAYGNLPENTYCYQFMDEYDPSTWFPAPTFSKVKLELTQGAANLNIGIFVQQPVVLTH